MGRVQLGKWVTLIGSPFFVVEKEVSDEEMLSMKAESPIIFI
jgi:hypothetical protein